MIDRTASWRLIHIPKTGGNALRQAYGVGNWPGGDRHLPSWAFHDEGIQHVAVIRSPLDRTVSLCAYLMRGKLEEEQRHLTRDEFRAWWGGGMKSARAVILPGMGRPTLRLNSPQSDWLRGGEYLIDFDNLEAHAGRWALTQGLRPLMLGVPNRSRHHPYEWYYRDREDLTREVLDYYMRDMDLADRLDAQEVAR